MTDSIPITRPYFNEDEKRLVQQPLETGWVVQGTFVEQLEAKFANYTNSDHAIASTSCTSALHLSMRSLELKPGDEVIVPAFTWISTANVVEYENASPVFCDVNLDTFNLDPPSIEKAISDDTVGIIPVHLFGLSADMDPIMDLADQHDLWVVEDAACGLGAKYNGTHVGGFGEAGCFSFHPRKSVTTGEGGIVSTNNERIKRLCRSLRDHGATRSDRDRHENSEGFLLADYPLLGYNYRMTDLQAAVGCAQMEKVEKILFERRKIAKRYDELLSDFSWIRTPNVPSKCIHGYQSYVTLFQPGAPKTGSVDDFYRQRNSVMHTLKQKNIATRQGTHAAALQDYYVERYGHSPQDFPNAYRAQQLSLALPLYVGLSESDQQRVVDELSRTAKGVL